MPDTAIAVVGMAAVFPGAADVASFWTNIQGGVDAITEVPPARIDPVFFATSPDPASSDRFYCRRGGFIPPVDFEPASFGLMPVTARDAEPDQLLALATATRALADAGITPGPERPERYGVVVGRGGYITPATARLSHQVHTAQQMVEVLRAMVPDLTDVQLEALKDQLQAEVGTAAAESAIDIVPNLVASRIANRLDLHGPAYTVDAACASSHVALSHAVDALRHGTADVMVAGGVHHCHDVTLWSVFSQLRALSPSQTIRPFAQGADGILIGEGTGMVVLKRLADAERDGDRIYAVVRGVGLASDGRSGSLMSPAPDGQVRAVQAAWRSAGLDPRSVGLIEGHGTATPAGDAAEIETLRRTVNGDRSTDPPVGLGSVKSMIGHAMPAAGIAGLIKSVLALHHGVLPPTLHCDEPHAHLADTRLTPIREATAWEPASGPRRAGVNAFGFGGINGHVVLEEYVAARGSRRTARAEVAEPTRVFLTSGDTTAQLLDNLADADAVQAGSDLRRVPESGKMRLAIADPSPRRLKVARQAVERGTAWRGRNDVWFSPRGLLRASGKVAFVFPGLEGSGTAAIDEIATGFELEIEELPYLSAVGREATGLMNAGRVVGAALAELNVTPDAVCGHSLGEWTAMVAAGVIPDEQVRLFAEGVLGMDLAFPDPVYLSVGADLATAREAIEGTDVVVSHDNCPHQTIVCGPEDSIAQVRQRLTARQLVCQELPFRTGFHTPMFTPHVEEFLAGTARLTLRRPRVPLWSDATARPFPDDVAEIRALSRRLFLEPVRFRELVEDMYDSGIRAFVQVGAGAVTGFIDDTLARRDHLTVATLDRRRPALAQLTRAAAALWVEGAAVDLARLAGTPPPATHVPADGTPQRSPSIRLQFDGHLVRPDLTGFRAVLPPAGDAVAGVSLPALATSSAVLDELAATLQMTATVSQEVAAAASTRSARSGGSTPTPTPRLAPAVTTELDVSVDAMPWLADHCLFRQPEGVATIEDRFPVVPMTTMVQFAVEAAEAIGGGRVAIGLDDVVAFRWLPAAPPSRTSVRAEEVSPGVVEVRIGDNFRASIRLAQAFPAAPETGSWQVADPEPPPHSAREIYDGQWMFHGPQFQGITEVLRFGSDALVARLVSLPPPGALLDAVGQLLGYWIEYSTPRDRLAFPYRIDRIDFYGPHPVPGEEVVAHVRIASLEKDVVKGSFEVARPDGTLWARVTHFTDRRFAGDHDALHKMYRLEESTTGQDRGSYWLLEDQSSGADREMMMRRYLGGRERAAYAAKALRAQKPWLLGRILLKDAVRDALWRRGHGPTFPIEVQVDNDPAGRPTIEHPGTADLRVSVAHKGSVAVAIVAEGTDVGIDIEAVEPRSGTFDAMAVTDHERELGEGLNPDRWRTRLWTAKEAVGKALGTGLRGRPRDLEVVELDGDWLRIGDHWVRSRTETLTEGEFIVSHTAQR